MRVGMAVISCDMTGTEMLRRHGTEYRGKFTLEDAFDEALVAADIVGYRRQGPVCLGGRPCRMDFQFPDARIDVEIDDSSHTSDRRKAASDRERDAELVAQGWRVLRLPVRDVVHDIEKCMQTLRNMLEDSNSTLTTPGVYGIY